MRVVRRAIPILVALIAVAAVVFLVREGRLPFHAPGAHQAAKASRAQAQPALAPKMPALPTQPTMPSFPRLGPLVIVAGAGWLIAILLSVLLLRLVGRWRTAFETKEWLLVPSDRASQLGASLQSLAEVTVSQLNKVSHHVAATGEEVRSAAREIHDTRSEFSILREELDHKSKGLAALHLGQEFHVRRPVIMRIIRALEIIDDDMAHGRDVQQTLGGVRVELRECLEDNAVFCHAPATGTRLADAKGADALGARQVTTTDEALKGTIAGTDRPGYAVRGPQGNEEVLVPAKVRVFV